jgi:mono/diheme cytochrome c family protein
MKNKIITFLIIGLMFFGNIVKAAPDPPLDGKSIFTSRCAACHNVNKTLTGPALAGVDERRSIDWIINFVHSSQTMVKKGDKDAVALFEKFNKVPMPDHPDLTDKNIKDILEYVKAESKPVTEDKAPFAKPSHKKSNYIPLSITKDFGFFISFLVAVLMLIGALLLAVHVRTLKGD